MAAGTGVQVSMVLFFWRKKPSTPVQTITFMDYYRKKNVCKGVLCSRLLFLHTHIYYMLATVEVRAFHGIPCNFWFKPYIVLWYVGSRNLYTSKRGPSSATASRHVARNSRPSDRPGGRPRSCVSRSFCKKVLKLRSFCKKKLDILQKKVLELRIFCKKVLGHFVKSPRT